LGNSGTADLNFGNFPGASDASVVITGETGIASGSLVEAWIRPIDTFDHTADEHMLETLKVFAANIVPGVGFTIYGFNTSQLNEPLSPFKGVTSLLIGNQSSPQGFQQPTSGGIGTRLYGVWRVAWVWN